MAFVLIVMSIDVCLPNDTSCVDEHSTSPQISKDSDSKTKETNDSKEQHHCICSLSCHNLFVDQLEADALSSPLLIKETAFDYVSSHYPQITLTLEKPPTV